MTVNDLYDLAEKENIEIINLRLQKIKSMSALVDSECYIGMDTLEFETSAEEKVRLAHELGHCTQGAFYNPYSLFDLKSRHEYRANKWAIQKLLPKSKLKKAFKMGITSTYEIAEEFGLTLEFVQMALDFYRDFRC